LPAALLVAAFKSAISGAFRRAGFAEAYGRRWCRCFRLWRLTCSEAGAGDAVPAANKV
jgi:hypothetical protein